MSIGVELTISNVISGATLVTVATLAVKGVAAWTKLTATQEAQSSSLKDIKCILGNGAPGTVVRVPTCIAMHDAVRSEIRANREARESQMDAIHEDIRSLHDAVRELHKAG
jgi:hypothetical protein